jgi:hypothetical protein
MIWKAHLASNLCRFQRRIKINGVNWNLLACTVELMRYGWRRHAFTARHLYPPVGRHPSRAIVRSCCLGYALNF